MPRAILLFYKTFTTLKHCTNAKEEEIFAEMQKGEGFKEDLKRQIKNGVICF